MRLNNQPSFLCVFKDIRQILPNLPQSLILFALYYLTQLLIMTWDSVLYTEMACINVLKRHNFIFILWVHFKDLFSYFHLSKEVESILLVIPAKFVFHQTDFQWKITCCIADVVYICYDLNDWVYFILYSWLDSIFPCSCWRCFVCGWPQGSWPSHWAVDSK